MTELQKLLRSIAEKACKASVWLDPKIKDHDHGIGEALRLCTELRLVAERVEMGLCRAVAVAEELPRKSMS